MYNCIFEDKCYNANMDCCNYCHHNPDAGTVSFFEWNGEDTEPSDKELEAEMY